MQFPKQAEFAFSILDDTDDATVANAAPFYALLRDLGLRTTKTVWPFAVARALQGPYFAAATLDDPDYAEWVRQLVAEGFEIASHNASMGSCTREETLRGLALVQERLGVVPQLHCNHGQNRENLYWGRDRYRSAPMALLARLAGAKLENAPYEGHVPGSPYFWGDIARDRFRYVRSFAFATLHTAALPIPPLYRDRSTPWVNAWFVTADAPDADTFARIVTPRAIDRLRRCGGHVIVSTHVGKGFVSRTGQVHPEVASALRHLAALPGWFIPATPLLDHVAAQRGIPEVGALSRFRMEVLHVRDRLRTRSGSS